VPAGVLYGSSLLAGYRGNLFLRGNFFTPGTRKSSAIKIVSAISRGDVARIPGETGKRDTQERRRPRAAAADVKLTVLPLIPKLLSRLRWRDTPRSACGVKWAIRWDTGRMSRRRGNSLPAVSPTSVIVEFHEFDGRWFITGRWGQGSGTEVKRTVRNSALGKLLLDRVEAARQEWRWRSSRVMADDPDLWGQFCAEDVGVPMDRYRPEKRIVILAGQVGITWHDASQSPPHWERLPDRSPRRLGKALIRHMNSLESSSTITESPRPTVPEEPQP
jgi:hypothetical protein